MTRAAVALSLACFLLLVGSSSAGAKRVGLIRVFAKPTSRHLEARHTFVVKEVLDKRAHRIGDQIEVCTTVGDRQSCLGALEMPLGKIVYQGTRRRERYYVMAVTGGTGVYAGSTGTLASSSITTSPRLDYVLVSLVP